MSNGDRWILPNGRHAIELGRSGSSVRVAPIRDDWPWLGFPETWPADGLLRVPSRYESQDGRCGGQA